MDLERHERKTIKRKKKAELKNAQEELFADLDEVNEQDVKLSRANQEDAQREELRKALDKISKNESKAATGEDSYARTIGEDIFNDEDVVDAFGNKNVKRYDDDEQIG